MGGIKKNYCSNKEVLLNAALTKAQKKNPASTKAMRKARKNQTTKKVVKGNHCEAFDTVVNNYYIAILMLIYFTDFKLLRSTYR